MVALEDPFCYAERKETRLVMGLLERGGWYFPCLFREAYSYWKGMTPQVADGSLVEELQCHCHLAVWMAFGTVGVFPHIGLDSGYSSGFVY